MLTSLLYLISSQIAMAGSSSSSELRKDGVRHSASAAFDGLLSTSWAEDEDGQGENSWLELRLGTTTNVKTLHIWPGKLNEGERSYKYHARPRAVKVVLDGTPLEKTFYVEDKMQRLDLDIGATAKTIRIEFEQTYEGRVFAELHIAEVAVNMAEKDSIARMQRWQESREAKRMDAAFREDIEEKYSKHKAEEFGDKESLDFIGDAAADGALYVQRKAGSLVGDGYRLQAIQSHPYAREALRKLKDPNAIPYLERAMLRSMGQNQQQIKSTVSYFKAYQEFVGGVNRSPKNWGELGWSVGEVQHFGEPLPVEVNQIGEVYLADIANNRIQHFNQEGRSINQWGGEKAGITNIWYSKSRDFYVSGARPGDKTGEFITPVDIEIIAGKEADGFATLEATGRIQVFNAEGNPVISTSFSHDYPAEGGLGGTAYLAYLPKHDFLCAIIQDQGGCFDRQTGNQIGEAWTIEDGTPNALEVLKNDTILMAFGDKIISYAFDGFRKKLLIDKTIIGVGYESLDISTDEKGKLWLLTDNGELFKFKKPGKVDYKLQVTDHPLKNPRFAITDDMIFISSDSRIEVIDIRQRLIDLEDEAKATEE